MAVTIDATVGGASANSYVTLAAWTTYMDGRLNSTAFDAATTDAKNRALVEATRDLDQLGWEGYRVDDTQALSWPREGVINPNAPVDSTPGTLTGYPEYATTIIPDWLQVATYELALEFLRAGTTDIATGDPNAGVIQKTVGPLSTAWSPYARPAGLARYPRVWARVAAFVASGSGQTEVVRS